MGYDLSGGVSINRHGWFYCLAVARAFGWEPQGTEAPDQVTYNADGTTTPSFSMPPDQWDGNYVTNDWQFVTDSDAANLAAALDRAITAIKGAPATAEQRRVLASDGPPDELLADVAAAMGAEVIEVPNPLGRPGEQEVRLLSRLADRARLRGFTIG
jgi:hypothetical protein